MRKPSFFVCMYVCVCNVMYVCILTEGQNREDRRNLQRCNSHKSPQEGETLMFI